MNKPEKKYLKAVYDDCGKLEKRNDLTEYGAGQGDLCRILLKKKRKKQFKFVK